MKVCLQKALKATKNWVRRLTKGLPSEGKCQRLPPMKIHKKKLSDSMKLTNNNDKF